jgi:nucleotide-binding universal stress UspA family protein
MNAIRLILVHMDGSPASTVRLLTARALAAQHGAQIHAHYAVTPLLASSPIAFPPGADYSSLLIDYDRERRAAARARFDAHAGPEGDVQWFESKGEPIRALSQAALAADLLVLGQHDPAAEDLLPADLVESVLIDSGKPALVLPYITSRAAPVRVALVAWKNSREAARALSAALPLLARAEQVHVATWPEPDAADTAAPDPLAFLQRHGIRAQHHGQPQLGARALHGIGELLLTLAGDLGAELLVMGCYGHGRARERVLGGASRTLLSSMTLPVLMAH